MYYKGGNMLHMIRQIMGDSAFRGLLHGLNAYYYHQTVDSRQIEEYISRYAHKDLSKILDQYLRTINIPVLEYKTDRRAKKLSYRWTNCVRGFNMPVKVFAGSGQVFAGRNKGSAGSRKVPAGTINEEWITPTEEWQRRPGTSLTADRNFYIIVKKVD
jgi:hypothetical protein